MPCLALGQVSCLFRIVIVFVVPQTCLVCTGGSDKQSGVKRSDRSVSQNSTESAVSTSDFDFDLNDRRAPRRRWSMQHDAPEVGKSDDMSAIYVDVSGDIIGGIVVSQCIRIERRQFIRAFVVVVDDLNTVARDA
jgi:hypothetical protein